MRTGEKKLGSESGGGKGQAVERGAIKLLCYGRRSSIGVLYSVKSREGLFLSFFAVLSWPCWLQLEKNTARRLGHVTFPFWAAA